MDNKIKLNKQIRICPFCGHHGQELVETTFGATHDCRANGYAIYCHCCGAYGPFETSKEWAVESWNNIHTTPAHSEDWMTRDIEIEVEVDETQRNEENGKEEQIS